MVDAMTFLAQVTDPFRVATMAAFTIFTAGLGLYRWPAIIVGAGLVAVIADKIAQRPDPDNVLFYSGFFAAMMIATITATGRYFYLKMRQDSQK